MVSSEVGHPPVRLSGEHERLPGSARRGPQWYVILDSGGDILAGAGVIDNDFHDRPDLTPNLCAVYVEPPARGQGLARAVLDAARRDMGAMGVDRLYLVTDHVGFYERCGWEFLTLVHDLQGEAERMYTAPTL